MGSRVQRFHTIIGHGRHPLADSPLGHAKHFGNLLLRPAGLLEFKGAKSPGFFPVVGK
jgi:hypothetical protein